MPDSHLSRPRRSLVPLTAAALLFLAALLPTWLARGTTQRVAPVQPVDATMTATDVRFEWKAPGNAGQPRLTVVDRRSPDEPVIQHDVSGTSYLPRADERARLQPGHAYDWFVEYRGSDGAIAASASSRFNIRD